MGATILSARASANTAAGTTVVTEEIELGGVDLASRKIPLVKSVEFEFAFNNTPAAHTLVRAGLCKDIPDSRGEISVSDAMCIQSTVIDIDESGGAYRLVTPIRFEFDVPVAVASSSMYLAISSDNATYTCYCDLRMFFEVKQVSNNVMIALLAS